MVRYNENTVIEAEAKQNLGATVLNLNDDDDRACYYNNEGKGWEAGLTGGGYPYGPVAYFKYLNDWRDSGKFDGLDFRS